MHTLKHLSGVVVILLLAIACAPTTFTQTRLQWRPYDEREYKQAKDGVVIEMRDVRQLPEAFFATVQACDRAGRLLINQYGNPVMERVSLAAPGQFWEQVAITNQTDHIVRLNTVAIRLFDPSGNQLESLTKEDLESAFLSRRPCSSSQQAARQIRAIKLIDRNMEIVSDSTATGWIAFAPPSMQMPGVWKFAFYDIPVKIDQAGRVTKATRFEIRSMAKKYIETYRQDSVFGQPILVESKETEN